MTVASVSFDEVVTTYQQLVFASAIHITGEAGLAEDAAQEAFIALYRHRGELRAAEVIGAWLRTAVRRIARDIVRRERHPIRRVLGERAPDGDALRMPGRPATAPPSEALEQRERMAYMLSRLATLARKDREVLVGLFLADKPRETVAAYFGISTVALRQRVARAKERLERAGSDPMALARTLGLSGWPSDCAERVRRSAVARSAARDAVNGCLDPCTGMMAPRRREPIEHAYRLGVRALALTPDDACGHALMAELCVWLARLEPANRRTYRDFARTPQEYCGELPEAPIEQAVAHAQLAERIAPNDPHVCSALGAVLLSCAPKPDAIPWETIVALAQKAHRVAPDSLEFAALYMGLAMQRGIPTDTRELQRVMRFQRQRPLGRFELGLITGLITVAMLFGHDEHATWLCDALRDDLHPAPDIAPLYDAAVATMDERLDDLNVFRQRFLRPASGSSNRR